MKLKLKNQLTANIEDLDEQIKVLMDKLGKLDMDDEEYDDKHEMITQKIDALTDLRVKLKESKVNGSLKPVVASSLLGIASLVLVLQYENENVITTKAISMLPNVFRGGK